MRSLTKLKKTNGIATLVWPIAVVMLCVSAMLIGLTFYTGRSMDEDAISKQRALVDNALTNRLQRSVGELRSVAWWDDSVEKSSTDGFDEDWLDQEIGSYMNEAFKHDRIMILDEQNRPVYAYGEGTGLRSNGLANDLASTKMIIAQARGGAEASPRVKTTAPKGQLYETADFNNRRFSRGFGAIVEIFGKPALATASLITPSFETTTNPPRRRIILTIIDLSPSVLKQIGAETLMPDLAFARERESASGSFDLKTDAGKALAKLHWTPKRPGTEMVKRVLPYIMGALVIAAMLMIPLIFRLFASTQTLARRELDAQHLANHDALTGLPNRRHLERELFLRGGRDKQENTRLACVILDLDRFKDINDTLGHAAGDVLICSVAERLRNVLRPDDFIARLGGDEFAVLRQCTDLQDSDDLSNVISASFSEPFTVMGHLLETSASVGVSVSSANRAIDDLMREADIALYEAKAAERGSSVRFAPAMASKIEQRRALEVDLKAAISHAALTMVYQPIVEAASGKISSVEALVRWSCPKHGIVPPDVFVALAEETGMMADLGRFVIDQAISDAAKWPGITTAINISPAQMRSATLVQDLLAASRKSGVSPLQLTLEITECVLLANDKRTHRTLDILREHGFSLALDDFGTGYSSLAYIRDFPFDKLKIDRSFVSGQDSKGRSLDIIKAVVNFGRILDHDVVAEGVETEQEMQAMQAAGVTHLQGYLLSKPVSAAHIEALLAMGGRLSAAHPTTKLEEEVSRIDKGMAGRLRRLG
jgi:diguanylate cyclase (GGDEF)-like protein